MGLDHQLAPRAASSPLESSPTRGRWMPRTIRESAAPMKANCTRCSRRPRRWPPRQGASRDGRERAAGWRGPACRCRASRLMLKVPAARAAPVPPAHTSACALPSATARAAMHDRGLRGPAGGHDRVLGLGDGDRGVDDLHPGRGLPDLGGRPEQQHPSPPGGGQRRPGGDLGGTEVGAVAVDRDDRVVGGSRGRDGRLAARRRARDRDRGRVRRDARPRGRRRSRRPGRRDAAGGGCGTAGTSSPRACRSCAGPAAWLCGCATAFSWVRPCGPEG